MPSKIPTSTSKYWAGTTAADENLLADIDKEVYALSCKETNRQRETIELVASENYPHAAVLQALSSSFHNKYSEGRVGTRYYGGVEYVDQLETLCQKRALELFGLDSEEWQVIVQTLSGTVANFTVLSAIAGPNGKILGMSLPDGGHLSHGHPVSYTSKFFSSCQYFVDKETGLIDYDQLESIAMAFRPKIIIAGISGYPRELDYARFRNIADKCKAVLYADMAHISGLVAGKVLKNNPFDYAHVVATTTHKTLRGPRAAMIFCRKDHPTACSSISAAHFPGLSGGPHNNKICALAVALKIAMTQDFKDYAHQTLINANAMADFFSKKGFHVQAGGTDVHMVLINVSKTSKAGINGNLVQLVADKCGISFNMNALPDDSSPLNPSGLRLGTPQLTTRGFKESDIIQVCNKVIEVISLTEEIKLNMDKNGILPFTKGKFITHMDSFKAQISKLHAQNVEFIKNYPFYENC